MSNIKTLTIDDFYSKDQARQLTQAVYYLGYSEHDFGREIENFNLVPPDADELFTHALNMKMTVDPERSGVFRLPKTFIHFEDFNSLQDWMFVVALQESTFNLFEHKSGAVDARQGHNFRYRNLFEWDLTVNYILKPGQGILFRPWLFHSFDSGLIQLFRMVENSIGV